MTKFTRNFICRMGLFWTIFSVISWTVLKMYAVEIKFEVDKSSTALTFCVFLLYGILNCVLMIFLAQKFTRGMRIKGVSTYPQDEYAFYRNFLIIMSVLNIIFAVVIFKACQPNFDTALVEGIHKVKIQNYSESHYKDLVSQLDNSKNSVVNTQKYALIGECIIQFVVLFLATPKLVKAYQTPKPATRKN